MLPLVKVRRFRLGSSGWAILALFGQVAERGEAKLRHREARSVPGQFGVALLRAVKVNAPIGQSMQPYEGDHPGRLLFGEESESGDIRSED